MARIAGVDIPDKKRVEIGLTYVYGIGRSSSLKILKKVGIDKNLYFKDLSDDDLNLLRAEIEENYKIEGDLRREVTLNIKRIMDLGNYRGLRHRKKLPVRGQRTKTNARTRKKSGKGGFSRK